MDVKDEVLNFIQWDDNIALPVANAENKILEEAIAKKTQERNKFQNELTEHQAKTQALREHIKYVKDELLSNQVKFHICLEFKIINFLFIKRIFCLQEKMS